MFTFLSPATTKKTLPILPDCNSCGLLHNCSHKMQKVSKGGPTVLVVDYPGADTPNGLRQQKRLSDDLRKLGHSVDEFTIVPAAACPRPAKDPKIEPWKHCQPLMVSTIKELKPAKIITYGKRALASVVGWLWGTSAELPDYWYGRRIPSRELNAWIFPIGRKGMIKNPAVSIIYQHRAFLAAFQQQGRPYNVVPDYASEVQILYDPASIIAALARASLAEISAFDYETNCLKPYRPQAKVFTASVAWLEGTKTHCVAFPMLDSIIEHWRAYLLSQSRKIAANAKFEVNWSVVKYGVEPVNMLWDNVIAGHIYDPQTGVAGLKLQAFRDLGLPYFASDVEKYLTSDDEAGINSIHLADKRSLLLYNGIDSLAELDLGLVQMYEAGRCRLWSDNLPKQEYYTMGEWR